MWKYALYSIAILAIIFTTFGCGSGSSKIQARLNEEFVLSVGQRASLAGEDLEIKFKNVTEDSRCPSDVTCIWAGRVTCMVELTQAGSSYNMTLTEHGLTNEYPKETYEGYQLSFHVTPYPETGKEIDKDAYQLHLIVSKPQLTERLGSVLAEPISFFGQNITVVGYYRGWDLLHETNTSPPVTRSDWVIKDNSGAIYVKAGNKVADLDPSSTEDTSWIVWLTGLVRLTPQGQPYIESTKVDLMW